MNKLNLRKIYLFIVLILLAGGTAFAQGYNTTNWKFSNPKQFGFTIQDVDYFDNNNVIAVGTDGGIAKSTDGGRNWTYGVFTYINLAGLQAKPSFSDVHFITATTAYAVGASGVMIKTTDGGATWNMVTTPLWATAKNINTCWFLDANKGYIGGQWNNTVDSLPKLYFTLNGGSTWDSIAAPPSNGVARCGYINNVNIPSVLYPVDAKMKEIHRIEFLNNNIGYICGSGTSLFPRVSSNAVAATCLPSTGNLTTSAQNAPLLWKFNNGVLTDYSVSKERIGYTGINTNTITCTTGFANITPITQTYKALNIINDTTVVMMSFNNNVVLRVHTGVNDSTANINAAGVFEKGKYEVLNFPFPPTQGPNAGPPIPPVQVLLASNPLRINRAASGKLIAGSTNSTFAGTPGYLWTSIDSGRNWVQEIPYPQTPNIIANAPGAQCVDIAPNGRVVVMGTNGAMTDSIPGGSWQSNYVSVPVGASYNDMEFTDCSNGIAAGGASITVTTDGGNTWIDRFSPVLQALNASINSVNYLNPTKAYFTTSIGNLYRTTNQAVNLNPVFGEPTARLFDLATAGTDSLWSCGDLFNSPLPSAQRSGVVFRSFNNGASWDTVRVGPIGSATFVTLRGIEFPTKDIGYIAGTRGKVYKTIDAGATWTDVSPLPLLIASMSFSDIQALNKDTVFVIGQGFPIKVVYRTLDGGATWTDITNNITALGVGNLNGILMHDVNNGYVMTPGGALLKTNNGGALWTLDYAPTGCLFTTAAFVPKTVGPGVSMINRKMFVSGPNINGAPMMEYGNPANTTVNSTEAITNVTCTSPNTGVIVITATGGLAPYTYSLNGGSYGNSNTFSGLTAGNYTISIKDAYCGILTKNVTIGLTNNLVLSTNFTDSTICQGGSVQMIATSQASIYSWTPVTGLNNSNIFNPIATPAVTTTYMVTATLNGCVQTKNVNINVNPNPTLGIVADPGTTLCAGDPTRLTVVSIPPGPLTGYTYVWSPAAGLSSTTSNPVAASPSVTTTYSVVASTSAGCVGNANITITVNQLPIVTTQPTATSICTATNASFTVAATGTGISYQWQESTNAGVTYTNITNGGVYAGATTTTLTITGAPFTMNGNLYRCAVSGTCPPVAYSNGAILTVKALPNVAVTPTSGCGGVAGINGLLLSTGSLAPPVPGTATFNSGAINVAIPEGNFPNPPATAATSTIAVSGIPGTATVTGISIKSNITHNYVGDVVMVLKAPNGQIFNLDALLNKTNNPGSNFVNTVISSTGVTTLDLGTAPFTGTFKADAVGATFSAFGFTLAGGPVGYAPTTSAWSSLYSTPNGNWTIAAYDAGAPDVGNITSWEIKIDYTTPGGSGSPLTYTWAPAAGLYNNATTTNAYVAGTQTPSVYAAPTQFTAYTVTGTDATTGCSNTATALVNYTPPAPTVTPNPVAMCLGDAAVRITSSSSTATTISVNSGAISVVVPDNTPSGAISNITVAGVPANGTVSAIKVTWNMAHTWDGDMVFALKAPNGQILNLDYLLSSTGGTGATVGFVNTAISSNGVAALSSGSGTYTGTFKADAVITSGLAGAGGPTGYTPTTSSWAPLFASGVAANGTYTLAMKDGFAGDQGTLSSWQIDVTYVVGVPSTAATWLPTAGLFTDPAGTIAYTGTPRDTVYAKPTPSGVYNYNVTVNSLPLPPAVPSTPMAGGNGNNMVFFNVANNNSIDYTLTSISTNAFVTGVAPSVRIYRKVSPIAGNPGVINAGNGWDLMGTATNVSVTANTLNNVLSGLNILVPAGATYGIGLEFTGAATFPAYTNGSGVVKTYTDNGCSIITDGNIGWGGPVAPGPPANNPRNFNGTVTMVASITPCTSPARVLTVTVNTPISITTQPVNAVVCTDKSTTFTIAATGTTPSYQWQVSTDAGSTFTNVNNGAVYSGASTVTLTITAPPVSYNGYIYRCMVSGAAPCPPVPSAGRVLTVNPLPIVLISTAPYRNLLPGLRTTFSSSSSPAAATYTWLRNGFPVAGGSSSSLVVDIDGMGLYRLRVTDVNGCTNTSNEILISDSTSGIVFIYPNPNHGQFHVRYNPEHNRVTPYGLNIYDALGKRILNKRYTLGMPYSSMDIDLSNHGTGVYWVEVVDLNGDRVAMGRVEIVR